MIRFTGVAALLAGALLTVAGCGSSAAGPGTTPSTGSTPGATTTVAPGAGPGGSSPSSSAAGPGPAPSTPAAGGPGSGAARSFTVSVAAFALPIPISRPAVAVAGGRILVLGGLTSGDTSTDAVILVDPTAGTATRAGNLPQKVHDSAATGLGSDGALVFAGGAASISDTVQRWAPTASSSADHLPEKRADLVATTVGDRSILLGGTNGTTLDTQVLATTDGHSFTGLGTLAQGVRYPAVATVGSVVWLFGGETQPTEGGKVVRSDVVQTFDVSTGRGQVVGHLPQALSHAMAFALGGRVFLAGGRTDRSAVATISLVETTNGFGLAPAGSLPGPRSDSGVAVIGTTAYLIGGEVTGATDAQRSILVVTG